MENFILSLFISNVFGKQVFIIDEIGMDKYWCVPAVIKMVCFSEVRGVEYRVFSWDETVGVGTYSYVKKKQMYKTLEECEKKEKILNDILF